ncbi:hypothetical protein CCACVL1_22086 [Corchorus capsularis]|uniref:Transposase (putative) gypsy type domain-containing protein n=1 Tax=Corchorus capsularis TaxID=210143 RepID=A0A1R3H110_COCAP|nr:hypothetical protein CCACVL1_22086 [Corchorus capsularis]
MSASDDSQDISRTPSIGAGPSLGTDHLNGEEEVSSKFLPAKRIKISKDVFRNDEVFADLSPLPPSKSSHSIVPGELETTSVLKSHDEVPVQPPTPITPAAAGVASASVSVASLQERGGSSSIAGSSKSQEKKWVTKYKDEVEGLFSATDQASKYVKNGDPLSLKAAKLQACKAGLGPHSGYKFCSPHEDDRLYHIRQNGRRAFFPKVIFECGFRFPGHPFVFEVLDFYNIAASQISPNASTEEGRKLGLPVRRVGATGSRSFFGVQLKKGMKWPIEIRWEDIDTKAFNSEKFDLSSGDEEELEYFDSQTFNWKELIHATRLVLSGISPLPYQMKGVGDVGPGVCPLVFKWVELIDGKEVVKTESVVVNALGDVDRKFLPPGQYVEQPFVAPWWNGKKWVDGPSHSGVPVGPGNHGRGKGLMALNVLAQAVGHPGFQSSPAPTQPSPSDEQDFAEVTATEMDESLLAAIRAKQDAARQAHLQGLSPIRAVSQTQIPAPLETPTGPNKTSAPPAQTPVYARPRGSPLLMPPLGPTDAPGSPDVLDLMAAFFTYGLNYANGEDFKAVRSLIPVERSAMVVCTSVQNLLSARANFAAYEHEIAVCAPQLSKFIGERMPGAPHFQQQWELDRAATALKEKEGQLKDLQDDYDGTLKTLKETKVQLQEEKARVSRRNKSLKKERDACAKDKAAWAQEKSAIQAAAYMNKARDSAIYMMQKQYPSVDASVINFGADELPPDYAPDPVLKKTPEQYMEENDISLEPEVVAKFDPEPVGTPPASMGATNIGGDDVQEEE